jgi:hypothetical protein
VAQRTLSRLGMFTTSDPVADIDEDLRRLTDDLKACRIRGETAMVERLRRWIDEVLEDRTYFAITEQSPGRHRADETATPVPTRKDGSRAHADEPR